MTSIHAQEFSRQDSLRGSITKERAWWDLKFYHLSLRVIPEEKYIDGNNVIYYEVLKENDVLQIDLQSPLELTKVIQNQKELEITSEGNAHFIKLQDKQTIGEINHLQVFYHGKPKEAIRAPWDGGFSWKKDENGNDFIATSCQGLGASVWWPCKDHMYDEVDSMRISVEVPGDLQEVSNGRLQSVVENRERKTKTYNWFVNNPINNYGVNVNIGNYMTWQEIYTGEKGPLDLSYWALKSDESKARKQFKQVPLMLNAFEHWFGPYPFYEDGYKLVQVPYLGMEHQSSVTYGNGFNNGYLGRDLSGTGWGMKFDFIIVHESGHEWFANNITHKDMADMWVHESFTTYSESLFVEYFHGKEAGQEYVRGTRSSIGNFKPMISHYDVNDDSYPIDVYYKGANMLNTLRTVVENDSLWLQMLRQINKEFYHQTVTTDEVEKFMASFLDEDLTAFFDQYLRDSHLPELAYFFEDGRLNYRWTSTIPTFDMPVDVFLGEKKMRIYPKTTWQVYPTEEVELTVDPNYYISLVSSK